jgi:hypothetical protein
MVRQPETAAGSCGFQGAQRLVLPFEGDMTLSIILSKAFLLSEAAGWRRQAFNPRTAIALSVRYSHVAHGQDVASLSAARKAATTKSPLLTLAA